MRVEVWFQDEARIGQKNSLTRVWGQTGSRPVAPKDLGFASAYLFGAVCPSQGKAAALIMPVCNTAAMNHHLGEISSQVAADAHAVVVLDGAGWHRSQGLVVPGNITLLPLPPYSPELNTGQTVVFSSPYSWVPSSRAMPAPRMTFFSQILPASHQGQRARAAPIARRHSVRDREKHGRAPSGRACRRRCRSLSGGRPARGRRRRPSR